jgi:hypothetical protein
MLIVILPWKRSSIINEFDGKLLLMKKQLDAAISTHLESELIGVRSVILDSVSPYRRFVQIENTKQDEHVSNLKNIKADILIIRSKLEK